MSYFLPSNRVPQIINQCQVLIDIDQTLPTESDLSSMISNVEGHIEVEVEGDGEVVYMGLDSQVHKVSNDVDKRLSDVSGNIHDVINELGGELAVIFEEYVRHNAIQDSDPPSENDTQEHVEWYFREDYLSMSESDWRDIEKLLPPSKVLDVIIQNWSVDQAKRLSWFSRVESLLAMPHTSSAVFSSHLISENGIPDPQWLEHLLPNLNHGYKSQKTLGNLAAICSIRHALNVPGQGFMSKKYHQWYQCLSEMGAEPDFNANSVSSVFDVSKKAKASLSIKDNQKLIMARLRRLLFLDPEKSKKHFSLFAPGDGRPEIITLSISTQSLKEEEVIQKAMSMTAQNLRRPNLNKKSLGTQISEVLTSLDTFLSKNNLLPEKSYSEIFHKMRSELEIGPELSKRQDLPSTPPKL